MSAFFYFNVFLFSVYMILKQALNKKKVDKCSPLSLVSDSNVLQRESIDVTEGACELLEAQHQRSHFNPLSNRSIRSSYLSCLLPGSPAVKLSFFLWPADFSSSPSSHRPLFLETLARTRLCCAETKQIILSMQLLN